VIKNEKLMMLFVQFLLYKTKSVDGVPGTADILCAKIMHLKGCKK
jgi:hypothetical protein